MTAVLTQIFSTTKISGGKWNLLTNNKATARVQLYYK